jgi:hypothetical protein
MAKSLLVIIKSQLVMIKSLLVMAKSLLVTTKSLLDMANYSIDRLIFQNNSLKTTSKIEIFDYEVDFCRNFLTEYFLTYK